jgi:hypothetical protein
MTGSIVYATNQGLGILAKDFYDNGIINKVLIQKHSKRENHYDWYKDYRMLDKSNYDWFFEDLESIIFFETPFDWGLIDEAKRRKVKTILMPMYECTNYPLPRNPDLIISPSLLDKEYYPNSILMTVPVDVKWKLRKKAKVFIHNAGNGGLDYRNGTLELLEAMRYVKSPIKLIIRTQELDFKCDDIRVEIRKGTFKREDLFKKGDVFIFPEKFNGLSLPLQEAFASGMLVMAGNRFPMNTWLPNKPLIPIKDYKNERIFREFQSAVYDPLDIAKTIDKWFGENITTYSLKGREFGEKNNWANLKMKYKELCEK